MRTEGHGALASVGAGVAGGMEPEVYFSEY